MPFVGEDAFANKDLFILPERYDCLPDKTAFLKAKDPFNMALAFKNAVLSGRQSYLSGRINKSLFANASSPTKGII